MVRLLKQKSRTAQFLHNLMQQEAKKDQEDKRQRVLQLRNLEEIEGTGMPIRGVTGLSLKTQQPQQQMSLIEDVTEVEQLKQQPRNSYTVASNRVNGIRDVDDSTSVSSPNGNENTSICSTSANMSSSIDVSNLDITPSKSLSPILNKELDICSVCHSSKTDSNNIAHTNKDSSPVTESIIGLTTKPQQLNKKLYTCPKCHSKYCSLNCYKIHSIHCTEEFYKDQCMEFLQGGESGCDRDGRYKPSLDEKHEMQKMLERVRKLDIVNMSGHDHRVNFNLNDNHDSTKFTEKIKLNNQIQAQSILNCESEQQLSESRLLELAAKAETGELDLEDLTSEEQKIFMKYLETEEFKQKFNEQQWEPWWSKIGAEEVNSQAEDEAPVVLAEISESDISDDSDSDNSELSDSSNEYSLDDITDLNERSQNQMLRKLKLKEKRLLRQSKAAKKSAKQQRTTNTKRTTTSKSQTFSPSFDHINNLQQQQQSSCGLSPSPLIAYTIAEMLYNYAICIRLCNGEEHLIWEYLISIYDRILSRDGRPLESVNSWVKPIEMMKMCCEAQNQNSSRSEVLELRLVEESVESGQTVTTVKDDILQLPNQPLKSISLQDPIGNKSSAVVERLAYKDTYQMLSDQRYVLRVLIRFLNLAEGKQECSFCADNKENSLFKKFQNNQNQIERLDTSSSTKSATANSSKSNSSRWLKKKSLMKLKFMVSFGLHHFELMRECREDIKRQMENL